MRSRSWSRRTNRLRLGEMVGKDKRRYRGYENDEIAGSDCI